MGSSNSSAGKTGIVPWLRLLRLPNLFTVPGDPLAGFLLAQYPYGYVSLRAALPCVASSMLLYMAGLISNDYFDLAEDRAERPDRPLPSGEVSPSSAIVVAVLLAAAGIAAAALAGRDAAVIAVVLTAAIFAYNAGLKRVLLLGPMAMGVCRGLSMLLGAAAVGRAELLRPVVIIPAFGLMLYIAAVTRIAQRETHCDSVGANRWRPATSLATCIALMVFYLGTSGGELLPRDRSALAAGGLLAAAAVGWSLYGGALLAGTPDPAKVSATIGGFVRALLFVQAAFCALAGGGGLVVALAVVSCWPVAFLTGRWFYAS